MGRWKVQGRTVRGPGEGKYCPGGIDSVSIPGLRPLTVCRELQLYTSFQHHGPTDALLPNLYSIRISLILHARCRHLSAHIRTDSFSLFSHRSVATHGHLFTRIRFPVINEFFEFEFEFEFERFQQTSCNLLIVCGLSLCVCSVCFVGRHISVPPSTHSRVA